MMAFKWLFREARNKSLASTSQEGRGWLGVLCEAATMMAEEAEEKAEVVIEVASREEKDTEGETRTSPTSKSEGQAANKYNLKIKN